MNKNPISLLYIALAFATLCAISACKGRSEMPTEATDSIGDSILADTTAEDSIDELTEATPPKKADGLFDDFMFSFMKSRHFQRERIVFPLACNTDGETSYITEKEWKHDRMYSQYEMYTLIFDSEKAEKAAKDTTLRRVVVEEIDLETGRAKSYDFRKNEGEWKLTSLTDAAMGQSENSDFYSFYHRFATENDFRQEHIENPLKFSTFDDDEFRVVENEIEPADFESHAPELPTSKITNILYGQTFNNSNLRILSFRANASGMECQMTFKRNNGEWRLTRLDN